MATRLPPSHRRLSAPAKADGPLGPVAPSDSATILPFPVADVPPGVLIRAGRVPHRFAGSPVDEKTVRSIRKRMRETRHVRLTDSEMIGPNEFEELGNPFHWTTWASVIVSVSVAAIFAVQLFRDHFERVFG